jgi:hypothetical protein
MDMRTGDVLGMKVTSNDGKFVQDTTLCKPGAKDSIGRESNVTEPFEPASVAIPSPKGGTINGKNMK